MMTQALKPHYCFVYGTLMAPEVMKILLDRVPANHSPAFLPPQYSRHPVIGKVYPGVVIRQDKIKGTKYSDGEPLHEWSDDIEASCVKGVLLSGLSDHDLKVFDWFEDFEYTRTRVPVIVNKQNPHSMGERIEADVYIWSAGEELLELESEWNYDVFRARELDAYLKHTVIPCRMEIDRLGGTQEFT